MEYLCKDCGALFTEPSEKVTSYESYYGVALDFPDRHRLVLYVCPCCGSEEIEEQYEEDEDE